MTRAISLIAMLTFLTGCGCKPDGDEPILNKEYFKDCWATAKRERP